MAAITDRSVAYCIYSPLVKEESVNSGSVDYTILRPHVSLFSYLHQRSKTDIQVILNMSLCIKLQSPRLWAWGQLSTNRESTERRETLRLI